MLTRSWRWWAFLLLVSTRGLAAAQEQQSPQITFRAGVEMVRLAVTVRDRSGRLVTDLARQDFEVLVGQG